MKKFKLIFHALYIIITLVIMYFSVDVLMNTEQYLSKIKLSSYIKFPKYVMITFLFISVLMTIEYVMQQLRIKSIKTGIEDLEDEVKDLKAKLYDRAQGDLVLNDPDDEEEEDDDDDT